ncbi:master DNA invertase Mpi family serine-type recombinase [Latilactobacillus sakei subsp. sakei]|uniref:master DNA invertase Mpi family serine-type recombinase n=1 Tax=Latilactobacillus sakei TaxID=1599 RepID=UPI0018C127FB|nr:master DNA invertase Mpi family serine-type recombinase [Latilactobacillus sakei]MDR7925102.1 master DNA invertase Mpi family serine-type recombinase [Latilactobacillus sakei subsp. sakei]QPG03397.1 master DNA invertase Mpi family serine-type recombinase [Latilactobacillus sakei]
MNYGYIRVSTEKQTIENQKFEINEFCKVKDIVIEKWVSETISGTKKLNERKFGLLMKKLKKGDMVVVSEISRLGRNLMQIMGILNECMEKEAMVVTVKEGYELGNNINSKVLAFAFGLSAEIERNLISQRTKEALARKKSEGVVLGRPKGASRYKSLKLYPKREAIIEMISEGRSYSFIARTLRVHRITVSNFISRMEAES